MAKKPKNETAAVEGQEASAEETKPAKVKKEAKPAVEKDTQNGITRPAKGTTIDKIWSVAELIAAEVGIEGMKEKGKGLVVEKLKEYGEDLNPSTVSTQYGRWRKYHGLVTPAAPRAPKAETAAVEGEGQSAAA